MEQLANNATTTLNGAINGSTTSVVVTSAAGFPAGGNFRILVDSELMLVTAVSGTTFTVTRGIESTAGAGHANLAAVTHVLTSGGLQQFVDDTLGFVGYTAPVDGNYSWVNQGGATTTVQSNNAILLAVPSSASKNWRVRVLAAPATPYTITAVFRATAEPADFWNAGLVFRNSSSGKMVNWAFQQNTTLQLSVDKLTNQTTYSALYKAANISLFPLTGPLWMRIADDGANRICSWSGDGTNFQTFHTVGRTDFLTADQVGFGASTENSVAMTMTLYSWLQG